MSKLWFKTSPPAVTDGSATEARCDAAGNLLVNSTGSAAAAAAAGDAMPNPTVLGQLAYLLGFDGTTWERVRMGVVAKLAGTGATGILNSLAMGRYNLAPPTLTDGDAQLLQQDASGNLRTAEQNVVGWNFTNITTSTTTVVKASAGILHAIVINTVAATGTITIFDNTSAAGTKIGTITLPAAGAGDMPQTILFDATHTTGITIVTAVAASDITVLFL